MITPINIALLGVLLAAVALIIMRRRRSGTSETTDEAVSDERPAEAMATVDEPAAAIDDDVFSKHVWAETAATMTPVREDEPATAGGAEADAEDLDAPHGGADQDTGEIQGLEPEGASDPDDGLGGIITEPGWYLPGEADMTRGSPGGQSRLLVPEDDLLVPEDDLLAPEDDLFAPDDGLVISRGEMDDELGPVGEDVPQPAPGEAGHDFGAAAGWAVPAGNGAPEAEPSWLGLADEEGAAAAALDDEIALETVPNPSDDLFALPPLAAAIADEEQDLETPSFPLDRWQEPATPSPTLALGGAPADMTVARHGPLTVSIDPAALLAIETEGIERSTSPGDGDVSWELTLKVELRQRANADADGKAG